MTKRILALFLVCILAIPIFLVPVSATSPTVVEIEKEQYDGIASVLDSIRERLYWIDAAIANVVSYTRSLESTVEEILQVLPNQFNSILDGLSSLDSSVSGYFDSLTSRLSGWFNSLDTRLLNLYNTVNNGFTTIRMSLDSIKGYLLDIYDTLKEFLTGGSQNVTASDSFKADVDDANSKLDDAGNVIDSATLPTLEPDFDSGLVGTIGEGQDYYDILGRFFDESYFPGVVLLMSFTLSTVSYVFFGKRG